MRISDKETSKVVQHYGVASVDAGAGVETPPRETDVALIRELTDDVIRMPDREDMVAEIKARVESGSYHPTGDEIADAMVRRAIADSIR